MCKILVMAGIKDDKQDAAWQFIEEMNTEMSFANRDGTGYTAVDAEGNMFGERWHNNYDAFDYRPATNLKILGKFKDFLDGEVTKVNKYNKFGTIKDTIRAITMHTRFATSGKEFENTHPFVDVDKQTSVIHNGVISNISKEDNIRSTCDSERILNKYLEHEVMKFPEHMQKFVNDLKGYFACGIVSLDANNRRIIDLFKSRASLHALFIKELDTMVFTTSDTDVNVVAKKLNMTVTHKFTVKEDRLLRLDALTGQPLFINNYIDNSATQYVAETSSTKDYKGYDDYWNRRSPQEQATTEKEIETTKEIINKNDPMNIEEAKIDGYDWDEEAGMWLRVNIVKH